MRTKDTLLAFEDIKILLQYFYINPENSITVSNGITTLTIRMEDNLEFRALNNSFPLLPEMRYTENMTPDTLFACIEQLKEQKPILINNPRIKSRWDEIKETTLAEIALNKFNRV